MLGPWFIELPQTVGLQKEPPMVRRAQKRQAVKEGGVMPSVPTRPARMESRVDSRQAIFQRFFALNQVLYEQVVMKAPSKAAGKQHGIAPPALQMERLNVARRHLETVPALGSM